MCTSIRSASIVLEDEQALGDFPVVTTVERAQGPRHPQLHVLFSGDGVERLGRLIAAGEQAHVLRAVRAERLGSSPSWEDRAGASGGLGRLENLRNLASFASQ